MVKPGLSRLACVIFLVCAAARIASPARINFEILVNFDGANGANPLVSLVQGTDGRYYGTTNQGGANDAGTVFKVSTEGKLSTLYSFCSQANCTDGEGPGGLVQALDSNFYGTTPDGGANGDGTVFRISPKGKLATLYSFCQLNNCTDGNYPTSGLIQATNGAFYGTTLAGGAPGVGTIFRITAAGKLKTLYTFCTQYPCSDGAQPSGQLLQAADGDFYGTTYRGGYGDFGTIFRLTPKGKLTTIYAFQGTDGASPESGLVQGADGNLYGTTSGGGANNGGTVFTITTSGTLTTLYSFCAENLCQDGASPSAGLVQATDGSFYGTTNSGGAALDGTVFKISSKGKLSTLYSFCIQTNCADGREPVGGLVQATNGKFYGTTRYGGASLDGAIFELAVGLGPFVETRPISGKVGAKVIILGSKLTGTTSVTFNGTAAVFEVVSASLIKTAVPQGATTGYVTVTTASGTLQSNVIFRVKK